MNRIWIVAAIAAAAFAAQNDVVVIRNARIHTVSGDDIAIGTVVIENGKIADVGLKAAVPKGARLIDAKGLHVYPGMINSATQIGLSEVGSLRETNDTNEIGDYNPQLRSIIAVNPESDHIPVTRANGITSVITLPSTGGGGRMGAGSVIAGQAALIRLDGWTWEDLAVRQSAAMQVVFPTIQMMSGRFAEMMPSGAPRTTFADAKSNYEKRLKALTEFFESARRYQKAKLSRGPAFKADLRYEAMLPVLDGKLPVLVNAVRARAIRDAIQFGDQQKVKIILAGPREVSALLPEIKAKGIPVIAPETMSLPAEEDDAYDSAYTLPAELHKAGIKFAFGTFDVQFARNLPYQAAMAVAFGLPYDAALKAVTLNAAEIWGVGNELGSIDKGKWADLIVTDGDPLETQTQVKQMFIRGKEVDLSNKHTRLYEKYMKRQ